MMLSWKSLIRLTLLVTVMSFAFSVSVVSAQAVKEDGALKDDPVTDNNSADFQKADVAVPKNSKKEPKPDAGFLRLHKTYSERVKKGDVDLLFIGDSITHGWGRSKEAKEIWAKHFEKRNPVNLGIGGDQTQHVLWRLQNGNLDGGIKPKAAVVMIGTNNVSRGFTAEQIAAGITAIVKELRTKLPETKILLLAIFPRGQDPKNKDVMELREKIRKTNEIIKKLNDGKMVTYLDIGPKFLEKDGSLDKKIMPDFLHLSPTGYQIWADEIETKLAELMGDKPMGNNDANGKKASAEKPKLVPVSGKVLIDGKALSEGSIVFIPKQGRVSAGKINADGTFTLSTFQEGDGAPPGECKVVVHANKSKDNITQYFAPKKYAEAQTSGLMLNVNEAGGNEFMIELTWKGDGHYGPFVEKNEGK